MITVAIVPCRAGSKGIPGKNTRVFAGEPLFLWAVKVGLETCDQVLVTTDDPNVEGLTKSFVRVSGLEKGAVRLIKRPADLASDDAPMYGVVKHALTAFSCASSAPMSQVVVALLQPTSPLRTAASVRAALSTLRESGADSVVSVTEGPPQHSPGFACRILSNGRLSNWTETGMSFPARRQDCAPHYVRDGTVYVTRAATILHSKSLYGAHCVPLVIPRAQSANIDDMEDWNRAEATALFRAQVLSLTTKGGPSGSKPLKRKAAPNV